jgi:hypothetical protein
LTNHIPAPEQPPGDLIIWIALGWWKQIFSIHIEAFHEALLLVQLALDAHSALFYEKFLSLMIVVIT